MEQKVKDRILTKALELFYAQGIHHTGINQIIAESGAAKASFYQYFPSKHDLVLACLHYYGRSVASKLSAVMASSGDFRDFIAKWISSMIEDRPDGGAYRGCPVANARFSIMRDSDGTYDQAFREIIDGWIALLRGFLASMRDNGGIAGDIDPDQLARRMVHLWEGAATMWRLTGDREYFRDLARIAERLL